ncbi:MAG: metal-dependent transcriptional regulator [Bacteroidota bacterium]
MATPTVENYLKALLALANGNGKVSISDLSKSLGVSTPSANSMIKKLRDQGLVEYEKYKPVRLTKEGRKQAALIVRKHRLTEMFLVERMGFGWEEVHAIAEQIEHVKSPGFFARMDELMGFPTTDPHGSPIPDTKGNIATMEHRRLSDCQVGETVNVVALAHSSNDFLHLMNDRKISLGTTITILHKEDFDGSLTVKYAGYEQTNFSKIVGDCILVD